MIMWVGFFALERFILTSFRCVGDACSSVHQLHLWFSLFLSIWPSIDLSIFHDIVVPSFSVMYFWCVSLGFRTICSWYLPRVGRWRCALKSVWCLITCCTTDNSWKWSLWWWQLELLVSCLNGRVLSSLLMMTCHFIYSCCDFIPIKCILARQEWPSFSSAFSTTCARFMCPPVDRGMNL